MNVFPSIFFEKRTTKTIDKIKSSLDLLINSEKFQGFWEGDTLFITKRIWLPNKITPNISVKIVNEKSEYIIQVRCELRNRFNLSMKILFIILLLFESVILFSLFKNHTFNILVFVPVIAIFIIYSIIYYCFKLECDDFRYELIKTLNRA